MRIVHVGNAANVAVELRNAQRRAGHESIVLQTDASAVWANFPEDWRIFDGPGFFRRVGFRAFARDIMKWADVVHVHGWQSRTWRSARRLIVHYHGSDLRNRDPGARVLEPYADAVLVSTRDLLEYAPHATYLPNPVPTLSRERQPAKRPLVVHAYSGGKFPKGTEQIRASLEKGPWDYMEITGLPYEVALREFSHAWVAVDQTVVKERSKFALECMGMGIPTVPLLSLSLTLREEVQKLIEEPDFAEETSKAQRDYVRATHDPDLIASNLQRLYTK